MTRAILFAAVAVFASAGCSIGDGTGLPCRSDKNCPSPLLCSAGTCGAADDVAPVDSPAKSDLPHPIVRIDPAPVDPVSPFTFTDEARARVAPGSMPRVIPDDAGGVDIYVLEADCGGLARAQPQTGAYDVVATPGTGCFSELDAARDSSGVVEAVARRTLEAGSDVCAFAVDADARATSHVYGQAATGDERGAEPRVVKHSDGTVMATWVMQASAGDPVIEDVVLDGVQDPSAFGTYTEGNIEALGLAFDDNGDETRFVVNSTLHTLFYLEPLRSRRIQDQVSGSVDSIRCGDSVHVAYRKGTELRVATLTGDGDAAGSVADEDLGPDRATGDVALACDDGHLWVAAVDNTSGRVHLASRAAGIWSLEDVDDAAGAVSLAVVGGKPHLAYSTAAGTLRYATRDP